jgi:regulator of RNase E activity RraA
MTDDKFTIDEAVAELARAGTGTLGSLLDRAGIDGIIQGLRIIDPLKRFAGRAFTVKMESGPAGTYGERDFDLGPIIDAAAPGDVIVFDNDGEAVASMGGIAALAAQLRGIAGVVADGALRDIDEIIDVGLPAYTRHVVLPSGVGRTKFLSVNTEVVVGGVTVRPGDIVVGDVGGLVVIPQSRAVELAALAQRVSERDRRAADALRAGHSFTEVIEMIRAPLKSES